MYLQTMMLNGIGTWSEVYLYVVSTGRSHMPHSARYNWFAWRNFLVSRNDPNPINWLPRLCDLTPLDNFLQDNVKLLFYVDKLDTIEHIEINIRRVIGWKRPQMVQKVCENWCSRMCLHASAVAAPWPKSFLNINVIKFSIQ